MLVFAVSALPRRWVYGPDMGLHCFAGTLHWPSNQPAAHAPCSSELREPELLRLAATQPLSCVPLATCETGPEQGLLLARGPTGPVNRLGYMPLVNGGCASAKTRLFAANFCAGALPSQWIYRQGRKTGAPIAS